MQQSCESPLVSVIVPAYNAEKYIEDTLKSIIAQTYRNIEILVIDDGSKDKTAEIVNSFAQVDNRIKLLQQPNAGVAAARNLGIAKSQGEFIAPIDADDIWYPHNLEKQVQSLMQSDESVGFSYAWSVFIDGESNLSGGYQAAKDAGNVLLPLLIGNFVGNASATVIRRNCLEEIGGYNCQLKAQNAQGCEDWDLYLRIAENYQICLVPEFLIGYRYATGSMSCNVEIMHNSHKLVMADIQKRHPEIPPIIFKLACANYYRYLGCKSREVGKYWDSLMWMFSAIILDPITLLNYHLYKPTTMNFIELLTTPIKLLIWKNHESWQQFKQQIKYRYRRPHIIKLADIINLVETNTNKPNKLYDKLITHRKAELDKQLWATINNNPS